MKKVLAGLLGVVGCWAQAVAPTVIQGTDPQSFSRATINSNFALLAGRNPGVYVTEYAADQYGLADAITAAGCGGMLVIPAGSGYVASLTAAVEVPCALTIVGQIGTSINAGASSINLFHVTSSSVTFDGVNFNGQYSQGGYAITAAINASSVSYITVKNCTFNNMYGIAVKAASISHLRIDNNILTNMGNGGYVSADLPGLYIDQSMYVDIEDNLFDTFTSGNPVHFYNTGGASVIAGNYARVAENNMRNMIRKGIEFSTAFYDKIDVIGNHMDTWSSAVGAPVCISLGFAPGWGGKALVDGNTCVQPSGSASLASTPSPAIEVLADNAIVTSNSVTGSWPTHYSFGGHDMKIARNQSFNASGLSFSENSNSYFPIQNTIEDNTSRDAKSGCIVTGGESASADIIRGNTCIRTPGAFASDGSNAYIGIVTGSFVPDAVGTAPILIEGNKIVIEQGSPLLLSFFAFDLQSNPNVIQGTAFRNNLVWNKNATATGSAYVAGVTGAYFGAIQSGNTYINMAAIGNPCCIRYADNRSLNGLGPLPAATDYTISDGWTPQPNAVLSAPKTGSTLNTDFAGVAVLDGTGQITLTWPAGGTWVPGVGTSCTAADTNGFNVIQPLPGGTTVQFKASSGAGAAGHVISYICVHLSQ